MIWFSLGKVWEWCRWGLNHLRNILQALAQSIMAIQTIPILNAHIYEYFHFKFGKVFVNPIFGWFDLDKLGLKFLGCYKPSLLKQNLVPRFKKN